ncbi:Uncharacterised protein [Vibrio cholerae]|nr:Uncharacterised protein [Vibrio cholerae]
MQHRQLTDWLASNYRLPIAELLAVNWSTAHDTDVPLPADLR